MFNFSRIPVYIKIYFDKIEITNLKTGDTIIRSALKKFSSKRNLVSDFNSAEDLIRSILSELIPKRGFLPPQLKIIIQQMEIYEGGLSELEKRALRDLSMEAGGLSVELVAHTRKLSNDEALENIKAARCP